MLEMRVKLSVDGVRIGLLVALMTGFGTFCPAGEAGQRKDGKSPAEGKKQSSARGAKEAGREVRMDEVVVTATKVRPERAGEVLQPDELDPGRRSASVDGLFKELAGVELSRRSFAGSDGSKVRIRGLAESRSLILLDGRNLHGAGVYGGYYVDWSSLSLEDVKRVEIIRGAGPAKYGNTLGGVVNVVTREWSDEPRTTVRTAGGNLGTWNAEVAHAGAFRAMRYSVAASHYETDGYLRNAFVDREAFAARLGLMLPWEMELSAGARFTEGESGMIVYNHPDSPHYDARKPKSLESQLGGPNVRFWDHGDGLWGDRDWGDGSYWQNRRWEFDWGLARKAEDFGFSVRAYLFNENREEYFYALDDPQHVVLKRGSKPEDRNWGWRADCHNRLEAGGYHRIEYGLEGHYLGYGDMNVSRVDPAYFPAWALPTSSTGERGISERSGGYVQDLWTVNDWLEVEAGLRFDSFEADGPEENAVAVDEEQWSPRIALTVRPWEGGHVTGRYARPCRFPTLPEYYWWYSGFQPADRKDLRAERAHQWELEVGHRLADRFEITARGYHYDVEDYIRTVFGYRPSRVIYNIDRVNFRGFELEASCRLPLGFSAWTNYTIQKTEKHGDVLDNSSELTDELVELPENTFGFGLDYRAKQGLAARATLRYVDGRHVVRGSLAAPGGSTLEGIDGYVNVDLSLSCPLLRSGKKKECRFFFTVQNLLDEDYQEEYGYPMPGITFMAGLSAKF